MKVLVIGGAGYIGSHAVRELVREGNDVVVLDALYTGHRKAVDPKAKFYQGDIEDTFLVSKILRDEKIDAVMHFAAYSLVPEYSQVQLLLMVFLRSCQSPKILHLTQSTHMVKPR